MACELWSKAPKSGVQFSIYVGDDDSTTLANIKNKTPYGVEKWSDIVLAKRSLNSRLYNLRDRFKGSNCSVLSPKDPGDSTEFSKERPQKHCSTHIWGPHLL